MAQIQVTALTFCYEGSFDNIFENVTFGIDTDWKLGFIGRNGKGKTTFAKLLSGNYEYRGVITAPNLHFDYFPYQVEEADFDKPASELMEFWKGDIQEWRVMCELNQRPRCKQRGIKLAALQSSGVFDPRGSRQISMQAWLLGSLLAGNKLDSDVEILYRPFRTLSQGEQMKVMLAVLFSGQHEFLNIDEPTNHLDFDARQTVKKYLKGKNGFILISHDRDSLDDIIDHVLVLNRKSIEVQAGNFSGWWENKARKDAFSQAENEKYLKEISSLKRASERSARWAEKNENTKIGFDPVREHDRFLDTRAYIGAKTKKMQARRKNYDIRIEREIRSKEGLIATKIVEDFK